MPLDTDLINWNKENSWPQLLSTTFGSLKREQIQLSSTDQNEICSVNSPKTSEDKNNLMEGLLDFCSLWRGQSTHSTTNSSETLPSPSFVHSRLSFTNSKTNIRKRSDVRVVLGEINNLSIGSSHKKPKALEEAEHTKAYANGAFSAAEVLHQNLDTVYT